MKTARVAASLLAACTPWAGAVVVYVDADAPAIGDGQSWATAYQRLVDAVAAAGPGDEIWIAEGTYLPPPTPDYFALRSGVKVYGGFAGDEASLDERDPAANLTVLEGDIDGDDQPGFVNRSDNAITLVEISGTDPGTRLDGLVFTGGYANTGAFLEGGAVRAFGGDLTISGCLFIDNGAMDFGGAVYLRDMDSVVIRDTIFTLNSTNPNSQQFIARGGAVWFRGGELRIEDCEFVANQVIGDTFSEGGAVWAEGDAVIAERSLFLDNDADFGGGAGLGFEAPVADIDRCRFVRNTAVGSGGGIYLVGRDTAASTVRVHASEFLGNSASIGGAILLGTEFVAGDHKLRMVGSVVAGHFAAVEGSVGVNGDIIVRHSTITSNGAVPSPFTLRDSAIFGIDGTDVLIENSIVWGNAIGLDFGQEAQVSSDAGTITANHSIIGGWDGTLAGAGSFAADPMFLDPDGPDGQFGTLDDVHRLAPYSPAIDAASNPAVPLDPLDIDDDGNTGERLPVDVYGDPRRQDDATVADTGAGQAPIVDIGAVEYQFNSRVADLNGDGVLDLGDITLFVNAFTALDPIVDFDLNGLYDLTDIIAFVGFFNLGCP